MKKLIKYLPRFVKNWLFRYIAEKEYNDAVDHAARLHSKLNKRVFVLTNPYSNTIVLTRESFRKLKRKHYISSTINMDDVRKACVYCTGGEFGNSPMPDDEMKLRREIFVKWMLERLNVTYV